MRVAAVALGVVAVGLFILAGILFARRNWIGAIVCLLACYVAGMGARKLFIAGDISGLTKGLFIVFEVTPGMMGLAFSVAALLAVLAALAPMLSVARTSVVQGLKTLD